MKWCHRPCKRYLTLLVFQDVLIPWNRPSTQSVEEKSGGGGGASSGVGDTTTTTCTRNLLHISSQY